MSILPARGLSAPEQHLQRLRPRRSWASWSGRSLVLLGALLAPAARGFASPEPASAQDSSAAKAIADTWQGSLQTPNGGSLRIVLKIYKGDNGALKAVNYSIDQGGAALPVTTISFADGTLKFAVQSLDATYEGKMSPDGKSITGQLTQGKPLPLVFERATPETAWTIPEPPPPPKPMAADANPSFEVATIKPSKPDQPGKAFMTRGGRFSTINTTLDDLIEFAYDVQSKQIIGGPDWLGTDKFDISAQPDTPGAPNREQSRIMLRKLLADRFGLKFHNETRELPAYVLTVAKGGPKMTKNEGNPNGLPSLFFRGLGVLPATNASMKDFCAVMQSAVLDRPMVDKTGLPGKYDFLLKWTPDESQFSGLGMKVPPPSDAADAPPPLVTALQEQLGLKLDSEKALVPVMVLDHADKPSEN